MISCSEHWPTCCYTCFYPPTHYIHITDDYLSKIYPYNSAAILIMRYLVRNSVTLNFVFQSWHLQSIFEAISEHRDIYLYIKYHDKDKKYCKVLNFFLSFRGFYWTHGTHALPMEPLGHPANVFLSHSPSRKLWKIPNTVSWRQSWLLQLAGTTSKTSKRYFIKTTTQTKAGNPHMWWAGNLQLFTHYQNCCLVILCD